MRVTMLVLLLPLLAAPAFGQECVAYRRAVVETCGPAGRISEATVVLRDGKIEAVGKDVKIPADAKVIDAAGCTLMPGIVEPWYEIPIAISGSDAAAQTIVIRGRVITLPAGLRPPGTSFTRVADHVNPYERYFRPLVRSGLVAANLTAAGAGQASLVRLNVAEPDSMLLQAEGPLFAPATNQTDSLEAIRGRLEAVARQRRLGGSPGASPTSTAPASMAPAGLLAQVQSQQQTWADVHDGKTSLLVNVANAATIPHLAKMFTSFKDVRWVLLASGDSLAESMPYLKGHKVTVVIRPAVELEPNTRKRINIARRLHEAGIPFAFTQTAAVQTGVGGNPFGLPAGPGGNPTAELLASQDFPLFAPALLVRYGLPRQAALAALTSQPAKILGLEKTHGTIEVGKDASLLVFHGDPLEAHSRLKAVLIGGKVVHEE